PPRRNRACAVDDERDEGARQEPQADETKDETDHEILVSQDVPRAWTARNRGARAICSGETCLIGLDRYSPRDFAEGWPSGLRRTPGKCVCGKPYRGFESRPFRQS